jgi:hypothetical protein
MRAASKCSKADVATMEALIGKLDKTRPVRACVTVADETSIRRADESNHE